MIPETNIEPAEQALCKLPVFRPAVTRILRHLGSEDCDMAELCNLIQSDPGLGTEMLILANSPLYGFSSSIRTVRHAVTILGAERVRRLATSIAMKSFIKTGVSSELLQKCWAHSIACGVIAEDLVPNARVSNEHAYTAGLLHEIGRLGLLISYPDDCGTLAGEQTADMEEILQSERKLFGIDHCKAGDWLARAWNLPDEFRETNARHHEPLSAGPRDLVFAVSAGCMIADALGFPETIQRLQPRNLDDVYSRLPREFAADSSRVEHWQDRIAQAIELMR